MPAYGSPWLFAVRCVLLRLLVPRHPPCALSCLITLSSDRFYKASATIVVFSFTHYAVFKVHPPSPSPKNGFYVADGFRRIHSRSVARSRRFSHPAKSRDFVGKGGAAERKRMDSGESIRGASLAPTRWAQVGSNFGLMPLPSVAAKRSSRFSPSCFRPRKLSLAVVGSSGLEPPTSRLSGVRSNRLSYEPSWWR
jgi:hypothetical protein